MASGSARLICRLPPGPAPSEQEARRLAVEAWLVPVGLDPAGGLQIGADPSWLDAGAGGLPFALEWQLPQPLTPLQELAAARQLRPWLQHDRYLRWRQQRPLWINEPAHLSQLNLAAKRLRLDRGPDVHLWGGGPLGEQLDGSYERPAQDLSSRLCSDLRRHYCSYLFHAHRRRGRVAVQIPAVLPWSPELERSHRHTKAKYYNEWLALARAWAELWHGAGEPPWVLVETWDGHRRWYEPPIKQPAPEIHSTSPASVCWQRGSMEAAHGALCVHGYYLDLLEPLLAAFCDGQGPELDLYLSTPLQQHQAAIELVQRLGWQRAVVVGCDNRGRDVAPFVLELLPRVLANGHPWLLKLHTKRSSQLHDGADWGQQLIAQLSDPNNRRTIASRLIQEPSLGLVAPANSWLPCSLSLDRNAALLKPLLQSLGLEGHWWLGQGFVAGSMFAARSTALAPLRELPLSLASFEPEQQQLDGTLAHALERVFAAVVLQQGLGVEMLPASATHSPAPGFGHGWAAPPPLRKVTP